jgi:GDP-mannose 6-dehydrogenase
MKIVVCGLGYVGVTVAACMLRKGATVVGVDVNPQKVETANAGRSPVKEPGVEEIFARARAENRLTAATTLGSLLADADVVSRASELRAVRMARSNCRTFLRFRGNRYGGSATIARMPPPLCVFRSTMLPGTMETVSCLS